MSIFGVNLFLLFCVHDLTVLSRIDCEPPDGLKPHFEQQDGKLLNLEQRFAQLEDKFDELSSLLRRVINQSTGPSSSSEPSMPERYVPEQLPKQIPEQIPPQAKTLKSPSETESDEDDEETGPYVPQPVTLIRNLQSQFFGRKGDFTSESFMLGDIVTRDLITSDWAEKLLPMFDFLYSMGGIPC